jgi:hypothetical protein
MRPYKDYYDYEDMFDEDIEKRWEQEEYDGCSDCDEPYNGGNGRKEEYEE